MAMLLTPKPHLWATPPPSCDKACYQGSWDRKYWKNIPGPYYSTTENMMSLLASNGSTEYLLYDDQCEFVWRQPTTPNTYSRCLRAMWCDEVGSYAVDGNEHWTADLIRGWWQRRPELLAWATAHQKRPRDDPHAFMQGYDDATDRILLNKYIRYLQEDSEEYLRSYVFLLLEGRAAKPGDFLPGL